MIDVLVAGGGPAGLATAVRAALAGLDVVVVEPRPVPVDKACGEGVMPAGVAALRALGVGLRGRELRGIRYLDRDHRAEARFRDGTGLGVRRTVLHAALHRRARELGVRLVDGKVGAVRQSTDSVTADIGTAGIGTAGIGSAGIGTAGGLTARWLVAADGLHSSLRRGLGLDLPARGPGRYGLRRHYRCAPWTDFVEVHWSRHGEAYVTPVGDDLVGVAVLSRSRRNYDEHLAAFPALSAALRGPYASTVRGAGPLRQRVRRRVAGRVLLVGDAAGYVDALTGEGIALAFATADAAVRCLLAGRPQDYERAWAALTRRHRALTGALLTVSGSPRGARLIVPVAARVPAIFAAAVHALQ